MTGLGFRRGSYRCLCKIGYFFPQVESKAKYFNGTTLEEEYARILEVKLSGLIFLHIFFCFFKGKQAMKFKFECVGIIIERIKCA